MLKKVAISIFTVALIFTFTTSSYAKCDSTFINPLTDICWQCIFPLVIGGVKLISSDIKPDLHMGTSDPVCVCKDGASIILGLRSGFFEPARIAETVKDAYCMPILGAEMGGSGDGFLGGSSSDRVESEPTNEESTFAQAHWYIFPAFAILDLFLDFPCFEENSFDIAWITEIDPMWNDDLVVLFMFPEVLLFANPIAQLSCIPDSISTSVAGEPINPLFWCMGSWGSTYPVTGHMGNGNIVESNAAIASRMIFKLGRDGVLWDKGVDVCGSVFSPIWRKNNYRMHIMKPVRDKTCHPIGKTSILWGSAKNPPINAEGNAGDNFAWMFFEKNICCVGYKFP